MSETNAPRSTSAATFGLIPPMRWCGVEHPHNPHTYAAQSGFYAQCPGSTLCTCAVSPSVPSSEGEQK